MYSTIKKMYHLYFIKLIVKSALSIDFPRQSLRKFSFCDSIFFLLGLSPIVNYFDIKSKSSFVFYVENIKGTKKKYYYVEKCCPPTPHNFILFELDFNVNFPLLRLLHFLSDLKSTILSIPFSPIFISPFCVY